jgi:hypothetical protein
MVPEQLHTLTLETLEEHLCIPMQTPLVKGPPRLRRPRTPASVQSLRRSERLALKPRAVNKFNIYTEQIPSWLADWIPVKRGYLTGNLQPAHMDFRFFSIGNLWVIVSSLATQRQVEDILHLMKALLNSNLTSVLVLDTHLATICLLRAGLHCSMTCCIVFQPVPPPEILLVTVNNELVDRFSCQQAACS